MLRVHPQEGPLRFVPEEDLVLVYSLIFIQQNHLRQPDKLSTN
jgi:hypothetical protein